MWKVKFDYQGRLALESGCPDIEEAWKNVFEALTAVEAVLEFREIAR
jgi:hypothetical protein